MSKSRGRCHISLYPSIFLLVTILIFPFSSCFAQPVMAQEEETVIVPEIEEVIVFDPEIERPVGGSVIGETVFQAGRVIGSSGKELPAKAQIFISTLEKNIESLFKSLTRRPFITFSVRIIGEPSTGISLSRMNGDLKFNLLQF